jgi:hypothetical protein
MLLLSALALADIPPSRPITHSVEVRWLDGYPDEVLILATDHAHVRFSADNSEQELERSLLKGRFWLLTTAEYDAWSAWPQLPPGARHCGVDLHLRATGRRGGSETHAYWLESATPEQCVLVEGSPPAEEPPPPLPAREPEPPLPAQEPEPEPAPAKPAEEPAPQHSICATNGGAGTSPLWLVLLAGCALRRRPIRSRRGVGSAR